MRACFSPFMWFLEFVLARLVAVLVNGEGGDDVSLGGEEWKQQLQTPHVDVHHLAACAAQTKGREGARGVRGAMHEQTIIFLVL